MLSAGILLCGSVLVAKQAYLGAKGALAGVLIERAADRVLCGAGEARPWPWADMTVLGQLQVPRLNVHRAVLSGATNQSLAFGIGHVDGSAELFGAGNCVLAGHRDGVFRFLAQLQLGDELVIRTVHGSRRWVVSETAIVAVSDVRSLEPTEAPVLTLITCWPINGLWSARERLVVRALCQDNRNEAR